LGQTTRDILRLNRESPEVESIRRVLHVL
jgi:hypothetical protein